MDVLHAVLAVACGSLVGFTLGLIGGGGSIMATPLLLYVVGLPPHVAIGTGALSVSANALFNFAGHARSGHVRWKSALIFAVVGAVGAVFGSTLGKHFNGQRLLFLFAILMVVVGIVMLRSKPKNMSETAGEDEALKQHVPQVSAAALVVGTMSGFFGIGGGFLIVPGLLLSTRMPMLFAVGSSLLAVVELRGRNGRELCLVRLGRLAGGGPLHPGWHRRRSGRDATVLPPGTASRRLLPVILRHHLCRCRLYDWSGPSARLQQGRSVPRPSPVTIGSARAKRRECCRSIEIARDRR